MTLKPSEDFSRDITAVFADGVGLRSSAFVVELIERLDGNLQVVGGLLCSP